MTEYQGHKNWTHWNVSLWLFNDESLYHSMCWYVEHSRNLSVAAKKFKDVLPLKTPDGASYSVCSIKSAMADIDN